MATSKSIPLKKGKACICCRRRKMKCDGTRPICEQCLSNGREMDCEYTDGIFPTRTELLEQYLIRLQAKVEELEANRPPTTSQTGRRRSPQTSVIPSIDRAAASYQPVPELPAAYFAPSNPFSAWWDQELPPPHLSDLLLDAFFKHACQSGFAMYEALYRASLASPPSSNSFPHLALVNAIFLWGVYLASLNNPASTFAQRAYCERAMKYSQMQLANQPPTRGIQIVQTEVLLATYFFAVGRNLEASYHVNAATRLAMSFGMHKTTRKVISGATGVRVSDGLEDTQRVNVFWKVFCLDQLWAITNVQPAIMRVADEPATDVETPWPMANEDFDQGIFFQSTPSGRPLKEFLEQRGASTSGFSPLALTAKATLLCERATQLSSFRASAVINTASHTAIRIIDETIVTFIQSLAPIDIHSDLNLRCFTILQHCVAYLSLIRMHSPVSQTDSGAYERCLHAARLIAGTLACLKDGEEFHLSPFIGPCCSVACRVLGREIARIKRDVPQQEALASVIEGEMNKILVILTRLRQLYPTFSSQMKSLQELLSKVPL